MLHSGCNATSMCSHVLRKGCISRAPACTKVDEFLQFPPISTWHHWKPHVKTSHQKQQIIGCMSCTIHLSQESTPSFQCAPSCCRALLASNRFPLVPPIGTAAGACRPSSANQLSKADRNQTSKVGSSCPAKCLDFTAAVQMSRRLMGTPSEMT